MLEYKNNNLEVPKYLFHGSPKLLDIIEQRQAHDSNHNSENEDYAVFLTSSFLIASAYAFKDTIKELSEGLKWNFQIGYDFEEDRVNIKMDNVNISDDIEGYVYIFPYDETKFRKGKVIQYKCYENIKPIDVVKVRFSDFKEFYTINEETNNYHK